MDTQSSPTYSPLQSVHLTAGELATVMCVIGEEMHRNVGTQQYRASLKSAHEALSSAFSRAMAEA